MRPLVLPAFAETASCRQARGDLSVIIKEAGLKPCLQFHYFSVIPNGVPLLGAK